MTSQYNYSLHKQLKSKNGTSNNGVESDGLSISNFVPSGEFRGSIQEMMGEMMTS